MLFDDFTPGAELGVHVERHDAVVAQLWRSIFAPDATDPAPAAGERLGVATALMMRGYLAVVTPRPPGNIHARQQLQVAALPRPGETIRLRLRCAGKELRRDRRYVQIAVEATGEAARPLFDGTLTLVWAA